MKTRNILIPVVLASIAGWWSIVSGCSTLKPNGWTAFVGNPQPEIQVDSLVHFDSLETFTVVPYSSLATDAVIGGRDENWAMFDLANSMMARGYRYVDNIASADLVLTEKISDDYDSTRNMHEELLHAPPFKAVQAFSLIASPFGSDAPLPTGTNSSPRSHPVLEIFFFTKQGKLVYRWAEGGLSNDENFVHASQHLLLRFMGRFPASKFWSQNLPLGAGRLGIELRPWSHDGMNFWPDIGRIFPNSPALKAGLQFGDELLEINGHPMKNVDYQELFRRLRGDVGDTMTLKIFRWAGVRTVQMVMEPSSGMR
jgi:hypothetical protein